MIESRYEGDAEEIRSSVGDLIAKLAQANLIVRRTKEATVTDVKFNSVEGHTKSPFVSPSLNGYSDMRDLLLIDPIHDVDEGGWPEVKKDSEDSQES